MIDVVNGTVIGGFSSLVKLIAPNGREQARNFASDMNESRAWGEAKLAEIKSSLCGDGKRLDQHPDVFALIYGVGKWEVRLYDA